MAHETQEMRDALADKLASDDKDTKLNASLKHSKIHKYLWWRGLWFKVKQFIKENIILKNND